METKDDFLILHQGQFSSLQIAGRGIKVTWIEGFTFTNKGFIAALLVGKKFCKAYPNYPLTSDWDVLNKQSLNKSCWYV